MDELDIKVLRRLMGEGRLAFTALAEALGLSPPAVAERVRRLEERGVIQGYAALVSPEAVGCTLTAFVAVSLERPAHRPAFLRWASETPEVQECHHIAGDDDYLLKVRVSGTADLERVLSREIKGLPGVVRTRTTIALSTVKESVVLPVKGGR